MKSNKPTLVMLLLIAVALFTCFAANAQKVLEKKGLFSVDKGPYINSDWNGWKSGPFVFTSVDESKKYFSVQTYTYTCKEKRSDGKTFYEVDATCYYYKVKFIPFEKEMYTAKPYKELIKTMYKSQIINVAGDLDAAKLDEFIRIYGEDERIIVTRQ